MKRLARGHLIEAALVAVIMVGILGEYPAVALAAAAGLLLGLFWRWRHASDPKPVEARTSGAERAELNKILDAITLPILILDQRAFVIRCNAAAKDAFAGCRVGVLASSVIRAPEVIAGIDAVAAGGFARSVALIERVPVERSFTIRIEPLDGASEGRLLLHAIDTTEQRRSEAMRVDFVANASHELRTPLASLLGFVETLQGPARDDASARTRFLAIMQQQAERMRRLIDDLLSLSRIEMRAHIAPTEPVDVTSILQQVCDGLSGIARERELEIVLPSAADPVHVPGDRDELFRLFENLIENGIKYGASGKRVVVSLMVDRDAHVARVTVRDFGPGIPAHHLPRLTERFYRADAQESREKGGTGLGLALVKHVVLRHRGRLQIESKPDEGAAFIVTLPLYEPIEN